MGEHSKEDTRQVRHRHSSMLCFLSIWNCDVPCCAVSVVSIIRLLVEWSVTRAGPRREAVLLPARWARIHLASSSFSRLKGRQLWQAWVPDDLSVFWIQDLVDSQTMTVFLKAFLLYSLSLWAGWAGGRDSSCSSLLCIAPPSPSAQSSLSQLYTFCSRQTRTTSNGSGKKDFLRAAIPGFSCLWIPQCCPCRSPIVHQSSYVLFVVTSVQRGISQAKTAAILKINFLLNFTNIIHLCFTSTPFCFIIAPFPTEGGQSACNQGIEGHFYPLLILI